MAETLPFKRIPLGRAYASNTVNATVFRVNALTTTRDGTQYATWYAPGGAVTVASRPVERDRWDVHEIADAVGNVRDAHNGTVLGVSTDGHVHLSYDHHGNPLRYRRTAKPGDLRSFGPVVPMTGRTENRVTYPQFVSAPDGTLLFFYRDGQSGAGRLCLNRYDPGRGTWEALHHPLVDGAEKCNPYWWRPAFGPDGSLHVAWCWRDSPDARTNHDVCYARSDDGGRTWKRSDGKPQPLPITPSNADVADPVPTGSNLINQCSSTVDAQGHPHLAHYHSDASGVPQYVHLWHDGKKWERHFVSRRTQPFTLGGGGTLKIPMSRPEIAALASGDVWLVTRDNEVGSDRIRLYRGRRADRYQQWTPYDVAVGTDLGEWEPTYDVARLAQGGVLSLFVLPCRQGNNERTTDFGPQEAAVLEVRLPG